MQVLSVSDNSAVCRGRNGVERIDTLRIGALEPGQWVLTSLGSARELIDAERAALVESALTALDAVLSGASNATDLVDLHFADLVNREPQLPEFLRPQVEMER